MAAKRTPLGHKGRGEAAAGVRPIGGKAAGGRRVVHSPAENAMARRIRNARTKYAKLHPHQTNRKEAVTSLTATGRRGYGGGIAATTMQRNPTNAQRTGWGVWRPGGV